MSFAYWRTSQGKRAALAVAVVALTTFLFATFDADARTRKRLRTAGGWQAGFASIVVDAKTGKVLDEEDADELRHPASLTKMMTLYMLFERLEQGKLTLRSRLKVSEHASDQPPSKLNVQEGDTIDVESAIKALVTRSANDVAVVIAEAIAEDEEAFAALMTKKARALGMTKTTFMNASGLPHREQVTSARDMATLGRALHDRFPRYYHFFSTTSFVWRGRVIMNHNRLLGRVQGVDGIKTGYTNASGFNLVTSVRTKNRHVVAVVLGGRTGAQRDQHMRELIVDYLDDASPGKRTAPLVVEAPEPKPVQVAQRKQQQQPQRTAQRPQQPQQNTVVAGSNDPIRPVRVKTQQFDANGEPKKPQDVVQAGVLPSLPFSNFSPSLAMPMKITPNTPENPEVAGSINQPKTQVAVAQNNVPAAAENDGEGDTGDNDTAELELEAKALKALEQNKPQAAPAPADKPGKKVKVASANANAAANDDEPSAIPAAARIGWSIQIGAYPDNDQAKERLDEAKSKATALLAKASPYVEKVSRGSAHLYRARFAGFTNEYLARNACRKLQRSQFDCIAVKN